MNKGIYCDLRLAIMKYWTNTNYSLTQKKGDRLASIDSKTKRSVWLVRKTWANSFLTAHINNDCIKWANVEVVIVVLARHQLKERLLHIHYARWLIQILWVAVMCYRYRCHQSHCQHRTKAKRVETILVRIFRVFLLSSLFSYDCRFFFVAMLLCDEMDKTGCIVYSLRPPPLLPVLPCTIFSRVQTVLIWC